MNTLREFLRYISDSFKDEKAYMWLQNGEIRSKTFTELLKESDFAAADIARRFGTRRKMALIGDMSYPWMCAYYGIMNSSNISVPMDTKLAPAEIAGRLDFADVSVVFLSGKFKSLENEICASSDKVEAILPLEEYVYGLNGSDSCPEIGEIEPDALASLMFTSGTSGDGYKAAMITHRSIMADVAEPVHLCNPGDRLLSILPVHHCFELFVGQMKYLLLGGTICINDNMSNLIPNLNRFGISTIVAVPAIANLLAAFIEQNCRTKTPAEVRDLLGGKLARITIGGASVSREVIDRLAMIGITVFVGYGLTETSGGCFANCDASVRPREAGKPYAQGLDVRIIEDEICLRGPSIMQGYYKNPGLTAKVMDGGWFHTGDIGELTDEGYVIIHGRKDNMIKTGNGEKVYPETWESRLTNMSRVAAAMVCAVNDHLTALILLKEDTPENREAVETEIKRINNALPNYEKILDIRFREKPFPLTTSMKIRRSLVLGELESATGTAKRKPAQNDKQRYIMELLSGILRSTEDIGIDDNLFECGLDSLGSVHLSVLLGCSPAVIYANNTVKKLSELPAAADACARHNINEAMKMPDINRYLCVNLPHSDKRDACVLLTGANGYLGIHLLRELIDEGNRIFCLVRSKSSFERAAEFYGFGDMAEQNSIRFLTGDITQPKLGLSETDYGEIRTHVGRVFHTAAVVNHVGNTSDSYRVNVGGTREVIRFCLDSDACLHHMSSYAVSGFNCSGILTENALDIGQEIDRNPYIQTKYQAEEQVLSARAKGIPSTLYRIGNLTARVSDGKFQMNADASGMRSQLEAFRMLGIYPESMKDLCYDSTAVDEAAKAISLLARQDGPGHIWHIINPYTKSIGQLTGAVCVPDEIFLHEMKKHEQNRSIALLSLYYGMNREGFNPRFSPEVTLAELARLGFTWTLSQ